MFRNSLCRKGWLWSQRSTCTRPPPQVMALKVFPTMPRQVLAIMTSTGKLYQGCNKPSLSHQCVWLSKSDSRQIGFLPLLVWDGVPREVVLENLVTFLVHFQKNKRVKKVTKGRKPKRAPRGNEMERVKNKGRWLMTWNWMTCSIGP